MKENDENGAGAPHRSGRRWNAVNESCNVIVIMSYVEVDEPRLVYKYLLRKSNMDFSFESFSHVRSGHEVFRFHFFM